MSYLFSTKFINIAPLVLILASEIRMIFGIIGCRGLEVSIILIMIVMLLSKLLMMDSFRVVWGGILKKIRSIFNYHLSRTISLLDIASTMFIDFISIERCDWFVLPQSYSLLHDLMLDWLLLLSRQNTLANIHNLLILVITLALLLLLLSQLERSVK